MDQELNKEDWRFLRENSGLIEDMKDAIQYFNKDCLTLLSDQLKEQIIKSLKPFEIEINEAHKKITSIIIEDFKNNNLISLSENIERAASIRRFLG